MAGVTLSRAPRAQAGIIRLRIHRYTSWGRGGGKKIQSRLSLRGNPRPGGGGQRTQQHSFIWTMGYLAHLAEAGPEGVYRCTEVRAGQGCPGRVIRLLGFFTPTDSHRLRSQYCADTTSHEDTNNHSVLDVK